MEPAKKTKKVKGKSEFIVPDWAQPRQNLVQKIQLLQRLVNDADLKFDQEFLDRAKEELQRMNKENKYQHRVELDQKIIDEINSKSKKK